MSNVAIFGVPRSGTSWLGQIFNSSPQVVYRYQPIFAYSFSGSLAEDSTQEDIESFHKALLKTNDDFVCQKSNISGNPTPQFEKRNLTHLVWKEVRYLNIIRNILQQSSTKVIGIIRHPCGVIKSWMQAPKEFDASWNIHDEWQFAEKKNNGKQDFYGYERWLSAVDMFLRLETEYPDQFKTVVYETLVKEPEAVVKSLFNFVDLEISNQTYSFLEQSSKTPSEDPYGVFRNNKDERAWEDELPVNIIRSIVNDGRYKKIIEQVEDFATV